MNFQDVFSPMLTWAPIRFHTRMLAFGAGRRVCLGESLAKNRLYLFVTALLQRLTFVPDDSEAVPDPDPRSYDLGLVLHPKPFKVKAIRRVHDP